MQFPLLACRYAELNGDTRSFTPEEEDLFDRSAEFAYASFRDKAAESRGMPKEELQQHAQGRVWSGQRALQNGLIDGLGGIDRAIGIAKQAAGIGKASSMQLLVEPSFAVCILLSAESPLADSCLAYWNALLGGLPCNAMQAVHG